MLIGEAKGMANEEHLKTLKQGVKVWNEWRGQNREIVPDLAEAYLREAHLAGADLAGADLAVANLRGANLREANLREAYLTGSDLTGADLYGANLYGAYLREAYLREAYLVKADLAGADLAGADLAGANLIDATLVETNLENANVTGCQIYGISAWNLKVNKQTKQSSLIITQRDEPTITVDDLEVAQFIYLLLNREKLRNVIDTLTSKAVLILGRFTPERKAVLDAMADQLRSYNLLPIIFDFERAVSRDFTETIKTLAGMSRFVIADITNPKSAPLELQATIPDYQIPFVPIMQLGGKPFSMFADLKKYPWVLTLLEYHSPEGLITVFKKGIIDRAFDKYKELLRSKAKGMETISVKDFLGK